MALLTVENLTFTYPQAKKPALSKISFSVERGEFILLCGKSGCGKSTLLRHFKPMLSPYGERSGEIFFADKPLLSLDARTHTQAIGFVQQNPDSQIVTDKVWHELAFGLESLGLEPSVIRLRVAEMASFFGIQGWFHRSVSQLSGGQKQMLNLASVMAMQPEVLLLDEPTSQLDPIAATDFLNTLKKINQELGTTIVLSEHRLEDAFALADRVLILRDGNLFADASPREVGWQLKRENDPLLAALPTPARIYLSTAESGEYPITVREGRRLAEQLPRPEQTSAIPDSPAHLGEVVVRAKDVWFRYEKNGEDILKGFSLELHKGEILGIVGGNGAGKSTALNVLCGISRPYRGKVKLTGKASMLPQDPQCLFLKKTVEEDLALLKPSEQDLAQTIELTELSDLLRMHPYDLSGGEQQRAALAKVLLTHPDILLLDEPTKGMDAAFKQRFAQLLRRLQTKGIAIVIVSHDIEFCAQHADRCALFFDGAIVSENTPRAFFTGNSFYTTAANRMCRSVFPQVVTVEDAICSFKNAQ